ncbi:plasmid mobilization protein [Cupriavidus sp. CP313]
MTEQLIRKRGRKPRGDIALDKPISVRLSGQARAEFLAKVKASGLTQGEFLRECVLANRTTIVARSRSQADVRQVLFQFHKAGKNLNQLAHAANSARLAGKMNEALWQSILYAIEVLILEFKAQLNRVD